MSAPYKDQSGVSGFVEFLRPILPTSADSVGGTISKGSFGIGNTTIAENQFYVNASPVTAVLYGLDVLSQQIFGGYPDLVISGPNVGNNIGLVTVHSGTVAAAVAAINKGVPAIAVSGPFTEPGVTDPEVIAGLTLKVLITMQEPSGKVKIPVGKGLNLNIPQTTSKAVRDYSFAYTELSTASDLGLQFFTNLGDSPLAVAYGVPSNIGLPGVSLDLSYTNAGYPVDTNPNGEGNVFGEPLLCTISPIEGNFMASKNFRNKFERRFGNLFKKKVD